MLLKFYMKITEAEFDFIQMWRLFVFPLTEYDNDPEGS
jgi:hypothetical protein